MPYDEAINWTTIRNADMWLDEAVPASYQDQPLAQDWARVAKISEEVREAIGELISMSQQNPRKGYDPEAYPKFLKEMGDVIITAILGIQHFTKDTYVTKAVIKAAIVKLETRIPDKYR